MGKSKAASMAIKMECINVIVPIESIRQRLGEDAFDERFAAMTDWCWHDEHLYREGCMNEFDLADMLAEWKTRGFELYEEIDGKKQWKDVCVVNSGFGPSYPCAWIEYDRKLNIAWLKGTVSGPVVGRVN